MPYNKADLPPDARLAVPPGHRPSNEAPHERIFSRFATGSARRAGHAWTFAIAAAIVAMWLISGPLSRWSDSWQLVINTVSSVVTFLMVFVIQHSQNRDTDALRLKLDELICVTEGTRKSLLAIDCLSPAELAAIRRDHAELAARSRQAPALPQP